MRVVADTPIERSRSFALLGYHRTPLAAWLAAAALAAGCATDLGAPIGNIPQTVDPQEARECLDRFATQRYMDEMHRKLYDAWTLPLVEADQEAVLAFRLGETGEIVELRVVRYSDATFARSGVAAMRSAAPFSPLQGEAACLLGMPVSVTLGNPKSPQ